jgi:hypothetical protein
MSQFTFYSSADASAPTLNGVAGSLVTVLDAILVNGYGSNASAGWTISGSGPSSAANQRAYKLGSGTQFHFSVDDNAPNIANEARIRGFESVSSGTVGSGQFPSTAQGIGSAGFLCARKSNTASAAARQWVAFADSRTLYFFSSTTDTAGAYLAFAFGDFYTLAAPTDVWNCMIVGRLVEANVAASTEGLCTLSVPSVATGGGGASTASHYVARTYGGTGGSISVSKHGDAGKTVDTWSNTAAGGLGVNGIQTPNSADNAYYLSPIWVCEPTGSVVRGRMRGFWHLCHASAGFSDGQIFTGVNDVAGKTFKIITKTFNNGAYCLETSSTLETN